MGRKVENNMTKMIDVDTLIANVNTGEYGDRLNDYRGSDEYIEDIIAEIADGEVSIYNSDIIKFISDNVEAVNDAIREFGWEGCGSDLYKAGQMAECLQIEQDINNHLEDSLKVVAHDYILRDLEHDMITEELYDIVEDAITSNPERMSDITDAIDEYYKGE